MACGRKMRQLRQYRLDAARRRQRRLPQNPSDGLLQTDLPAGWLLLRQGSAEFGERAGVYGRGCWRNRWRFGLTPTLSSEIVQSGRSKSVKNPQIRVLMPKDVALVIWIAGVWMTITMFKAPNVTWVERLSWLFILSCYTIGIVKWARTKA